MRERGGDLRAGQGRAGPDLRDRRTPRRTQHPYLRLRCACGEAESDLDLLIDLEPDRSLLDPVALESELEALLGISVDVAEPVSLHRYIRDRVTAEAVLL